jgi:hypothetical protein
MAVDEPDLVVGTQRSIQSDKHGAFANRDNVPTRP